MLGALARDQLCDRRAAEASLERARRGRARGIVLPFVLLPVRDLLECLPRHRTARPTLRRTILDVLDGGARRQADTASGPLDDLSECGTAGCPLPPEQRSGAGDRRRAVRSTNSVRTHLRQIYGNSASTARAEAVERARELGLLAPSHRRR